MSRISKSRGTDGRLVVCREWGGSVWGKWGATAPGYRVSFRSDKSVLKLIVVVVAQLGEYIQTTGLYTSNG